MAGTAKNVLSRDGTRVGYLTFGEGPAVIVLPGVLSLAEDCARLAWALAERFTVHVMERRGRLEPHRWERIHGYSQLAAAEH